MISLLTEKGIKSIIAPLKKSRKLAHGEDRIVEELA